MGIKERIHDDVFIRNEENLEYIYNLKRISHILLFERERDGTAEKGSIDGMCCL